MTQELIPVWLTKAELESLPNATRHRLLQGLKGLARDLEFAWVKEETDAEQPDVYTKAPLCKDCHAEIRPTQKYKLEQVLAIAQKRYGRFLCYQCAMKAKEQLELKP